jgi:hypothetical protein
MPFDRDLRNLIVATKASPPIDDALKQQREKLRMKRKIAEHADTDIDSHTPPDEVQKA